VASGEQLGLGCRRQVLVKPRERLASVGDVDAEAAGQDDVITVLPRDVYG